MVIINKKTEVLNVLSKTNAGIKLPNRATVTIIIYKNAMLYLRVCVMFGLRLTVVYTCLYMYGEYILTYIFNPST